MEILSGAKDRFAAFWRSFVLNMLYLISRKFNGLVNEVILIQKISFSIVHSL
jgi:hypothetical protein